MSNGSFPGVKRPGLGVHHPPLSSAEVKEKVEMPLLLFWAFVACFRANFTFAFYLLPTVIYRRYGRAQV
jgi:hypothetical protein